MSEACAPTSYLSCWHKKLLCPTLKMHSVKLDACGIGEADYDKLQEFVDCLIKAIGMNRLGDPSCDMPLTVYYPALRWLRP